MKLHHLWKLAISFLAVFLAGLIGSLATFQSIPTWYASLNKTVLTPPNWVFGPVWTTLYILMAISVYLVWKKKGASKDENLGLVFFGVQLVLNSLWSIIFFAGHEILGAFVELVVLWVFVILTIIWFNKTSKLAAWLLAPYLVWISFAGILNFATYLANK
jgi:tryptophan-rich sensory protein